MAQSIEEIAERIIICAAHRINGHHRQNPDSPIFSVCDSHDLSWARQDFHFDNVNYYQCSLHNPPFSLEGTELEEFRGHAALKDFQMAKSFLEDSDDKKVIFHCRAGVHKSPMFVFHLLNYLQGENPDFDLSLRMLQKIRPEARLGANLLLYKANLGKKYDECQRVILDFMVAKSLVSSEDEDGLNQTISSVFKGSAKVEISQASDLCCRFGMKLPVFTI